MIHTTRIVSGSGASRPLVRGLRMAERAGRLAARSRRPIAAGQPFGPTGGVVCNVSDGLVTIVGTRGEDDDGLMWEREVDDLSDIRKVVIEMARLAAGPVEDTVSHSIDVGNACAMVSALADQAGLKHDWIMMNPPSPGRATLVELGRLDGDAIPCDGSIEAIVEAMIPPSVYVKWSGGIPVLCLASGESHPYPFQSDPVEVLRRVADLVVPLTSCFGKDAA